MTKATEVQPFDLYITVEAGRCACGCGHTVNRGRQFLQGHDAKLKSALITTALEGGEVHEYGGGAVVTCGPLEYAAKFGFGHMVHHAIDVRRDKAAKRQAKKDAKTLDKMVRASVAIADDGIATLVRGEDADAGANIEAKVGRWTYEGKQVGDAFVYVAKDGTQKTTTKFSVVL